MAEPLPVSADRPLSRTDMWLQSARGPEGLTPVDLSAEAVKSLAPIFCPKCQWRLIDPKTLGYCPKCGYCRYVEDARRDAHAPTPKAPNGLWMAISTVSRALADVPGWVSIMLTGSFAVMLYCKAIDGLLPDDGHERAVIGLLGIAAGLLTTFLCQFWVLIRVAPLYPDMTVADVFMRPALFWQSAVRELPATRWPIWMAAWGIALALGAAIIIGGQAYWFPDAPPPGPGWWE